MAMRDTVSSMALSRKHGMLRWLLVIGLLGVAACESDGRGTNGADCIKNDDCESDHCISGKCRPKPQTSGSAGSAGSSG